MAGTIEVGLEKNYPVVLGAGLDIAASLPETIHPGTCAIVTDSTVAKLHLDTVRENLESAGWRVAVTVEVGAGESSKNLGIYAEAMSRLASANLSRDATVFALGGGVVGDLGGFVAATYMRGVRLVMLPTTLLAMVDSSVGGKTGVDLPEGKNLVGAFHQPEAVVADLDWLSTLPEAEISNGLAEAIKMGLLAGGDFFSDLSRIPLARNRDLRALETLVAHSVTYKAKIVSEDEREAGLRAVLNYGHTIGHAIEAATSFAVPHGEAVALGMKCAAYLSETKLGFDSSQIQNHIIHQAGLPSSLEGSLGGTGVVDMVGRLNPSEIVSGMGRDKKRLSGDGGKNHRFVLLAGVGEPRWGISVTEEEVIESLAEILPASDGTEGE